MKAFLQAAILSLDVLTGTASMAADNLDVERLATCQDSWFEWKTTNPARLEQVINRFRSDFTHTGDDAFFVPRSSQTVIGLPIAQAFPQSIGMGVGFSIVVKANFDRTKAALEKKLSRKLKCDPPSDGMRSCGLELAEKKTVLMMAEDSPTSTTTLFGCYYFYEK